MLEQCPAASPVGHLERLRGATEPEKHVDEIGVNGRLIGSVGGPQEAGTEVAPYPLHRGYRRLGRRGRKNQPRKLEIGSSPQGGSLRCCTIVAQSQLSAGPLQCPKCR